jgi:hypothetical protein
MNFTHCQGLTETLRGRRRGNIIRAGGFLTIEP